MRSHETVTAFTRQAVEYMFEAGCPMVVLACNTASARALRTLQQRYLPVAFPDRRLLGVVRPSAEALAGLPPGAIPGVTPPALTEGTVAVLGTKGTIASDSYRLELNKLAPGLTLVQQACPLWVPLVESGELDGPGTQHFLHQYLDPLFAKDAQQPSRILLGCTHYPLLVPAIKKIIPANVELLSQGPLVAERLADWLQRHPEMENRLGRSGTRRFVTTDDPEWFAEHATWILDQPVDVEKVEIG